MKRFCPEATRLVSVGGCDVLESEPQNVPSAGDETEEPRREQGWREIRGRCIVHSVIYFTDKSTMQL